MPLESPRPFPAHLRPLVARYAGSAERTSYTTGPATRRALSEVGALGATTGSVVHLAQRPSADPASIGVLAHELSHARNPVSRPRFLLRNPGGAMDADERAARTAGEIAQSAGGSGIARSAPVIARSAAGQSIARSAIGPGITVQRLGLPGMPSMPSAPQLPGMPTIPNVPSVPGGLGAVDDGVSDAAGAVRNRVSSAASGIGDRVASQAGAISAGIVDSLRVGGASAAGVVDAAQAAKAAVESTVRDTATSAVNEASQAGGELDATAARMLSQLDSLSTDAGAAAGQVASGVTGAAQSVGSMATGAAQSMGNMASGALSQAQGAVAGGVNALAGAASAAGGLAKADLDRIAEALEERLLREIERRGGRYAGVF